MGCCGFCSTKKDLGKVLWCIPLSVFALLFAAFEIAYPGWQLYSIIQSDLWHSVSGYISVALNCVHIVVGLTAIIAIFVRWAPGLTFLSIAAKFVIFAYVFSFISLWFMWIAQMLGHYTDDGKKWKPDSHDIVLMSITTALMALVILLGWSILSCCASLRMVIGAGGTGFEGLNYKQIKTGDKRAVESDTDDSSV